MLRFNDVQITDRPTNLLQITGVNRPHQLWLRRYFSSLMPRTANFAQHVSLTLARWRFWPNELDFDKN